MAWQGMGFKVAQYAARRPMRERIDLDPAAFAFDERKVTARGRLKPFASADPSVITVKRFGERQDLADFAAAIRIGRPKEIFRIFPFEEIGVWPDGFDIRQAKARDEFVAISEGLRKQNERVDKYHRHALVDFRDHMEKHGGICAKTRDKRNPAFVQLLDCRAHHSTRIHACKRRGKSRRAF